MGEREAVATETEGRESQDRMGEKERRRSRSQLREKEGKATPAGKKNEKADPRSPERDSEGGLH